MNGWSRIAAVFSLMLVAACSDLTPQQRNTALGAAVGGVAGSALTGGETGGAIGGAVVGGVIGNQIKK
jgi:osmotically inducible lipoprotein OsmB